MLQLLFKRAVGTDLRTRVMSFMGRDSGKRVITTCNPWSQGSQDQPSAAGNLINHVSQPFTVCRVTQHSSGARVLLGDTCVIAPAMLCFCFWCVWQVARFAVEDVAEGFCWFTA